MSVGRCSLTVVLVLVALVGCRPLSQSDDRNHEPAAGDGSLARPSEPLATSAPVRGEGVATGLALRADTQDDVSADADRDGWPDHSDKCPDDTETYEGTDDQDGCPDAPSRIRPSADGMRIELLEPVVWKDAWRGILAEPEPAVLRDLAAMLQARPGLAIEIHAHEAPRTDAFGSKPTDRQARAVRDWLVSRGIDPHRMFVQGYGESRPLASNATAEGRAVNARIEVWIREPQPEGRLDGG